MTLFFLIYLATTQIGLVGCQWFIHNHLLKYYFFYFVWEAQNILRKRFSIRALRPFPPQTLNIRKIFFSYFVIFSPAASVFLRKQMCFRVSQNSYKNNLVLRASKNSIKSFLLLINISESKTPAQRSKKYSFAYILSLF